MSDSTLKELWQQVAEKKSCEAKQKELTAQRDTLADRLKKLEKSKLAEQADVDRLEGHSLAAFFYQVIGKMDEKLDKERQEAYAARVKYDAALHDLSSVDADLEQIQNRLERLSDCERQYQAALSEKIKSIKVSAHPAAQQVAESESRIAALKVQKPGAARGHQRRKDCPAYGQRSSGNPRQCRGLEYMGRDGWWSGGGSRQVCGTGRCAGTNRTASSGTAAVQN